LRTEKEREFLDLLEIRARESQSSHVARLSNFPAWVPRQNLARFLASYEIYKQIVGLHGVVIEGGVAGGAGLLTWAHLASILEPYNYSRRVIGFDLAADKALWSDIERLALLHDENRPLGHIGRIELVAGDAVTTAPFYAKEHPELAVALLVLDFTTYEPTRVTLETLWPMVPKGGVIVSGGIWPDELRALAPYGLSFQRCHWSTTLIWAVKE